MPAMDDHSDTGGSGWSTVGQLAPVRHAEADEVEATVQASDVDHQGAGGAAAGDQPRWAGAGPIAATDPDASADLHGPAGDTTGQADGEGPESDAWLEPPAEGRAGEDVPLEPVFDRTEVVPPVAQREWDSLAGHSVVDLDQFPAVADTPTPEPPVSSETPVEATPVAPPAEARRPVSVVRPLPRIMAIANQKGGVGKTTTAVNLGAALAELGYRVLVVDLDPQGNATTGLGINARNLQSSIYDVLLNDLSLEDCIEPTAVRNLFLAPATIDLAGAEIELVPAFSRELRLRRALERLGDDYDFTLIDCPPSLGLLTVNGLAAASEVVVPIQCEYYALEGLGQLLRNVELVQRNLNPTLELGAIILTMYDARTKLSDQVTKEVRQHFGPKVCRNIVPRTVRLSEAPSFGQPIIVFDSTSRGAIAYRELAKEVSGGAPRRAR
jgi:chromosome partitioning protein